MTLIKFFVEEKRITNWNYNSPKLLKNWSFGEL